MNKGKACGAMGSGRDGAGSSSVFWENLGNRNSAVVALAVGVAAEAQRAFIWESSAEG
jgi:hypothetical protein